MEVVKDISNLYLTNTALTLGKFEGLHRGHQALLTHILAEKSNNLTSVVFTFHPHPAVFFGDGKHKLINTNEERLRKLTDMGIELVIEYPFDEKIMKMEPEAFVKDILVDHLGVKVITVGEDYRFGHKRSGDVELLIELGKKYGFQVNALRKKQIENEIISSSLIKKYIEYANIEKANDLLGSPFSIIGTVLHGRKLGRTIGIPTTNLIPPVDKLLPPNGVYLSLTKIDHKEYPGLTNIGYKPSVGSTDFKGVETFMFDFDEDVYGKEIEVKILKNMRPEVKFSSVDDMITQIQIDIDDGKEYFKL